MNDANNASIIIKKKIYKGHGAGHSASWKIALADFAMAMMAFFLLMWIIASASDEEKQAIAGYFQKPEVIITGQVPIIIPNMHPLTAKEQSSTIETGKAALESFLLAEQDKLGIIAEDVGSIVQELMESIADGELEVEVREDRIVIRIMEHGSFPSGSAEICKEFMPVLKKVAKVLQITPGKVTVSGYTDNIPIHTAIYRSNRELSAIRAVSVAEELLKNKKIKPKRFVINGYGENEPIATNDTNEGRAKNRRVELEIFQGIERKQPGKIITIEKDADAKLLPNIEKTDAIIESVFPPVTDIDFDGYGEYLEQGELGVYDKDVLYNYELNDVIVKPQPQTKDLPELEAEITKPDDLGVFAADTAESASKVKTDDLGIFVAKPPQSNSKTKPDDLGIYQGTKKSTTKPQIVDKTQVPLTEASKIVKQPKKLTDELGIYQPKSSDVTKPEKTDELGIFQEQQSNAVKELDNDELGIYQGKKLSPANSLDELGIYQGKERQDPKDLGLMPAPVPKKKTEIIVE